MDEAARKRSATQKFIQQFPECCFCGGLRPATTREHMPPKSLFDQSYRPDRLVMPACDVCNGATSTADLTVAMVSRWRYDSGPQERLDHSKLAARMRRQAPELMGEWTKLDRTEAEKARLHLINSGVPVPQDAGIATIGPLTICQLNLFAHKAVLAPDCSRLSQRSRTVNQARPSRLNRGRCSRHVSSPIHCMGQQHLRDGSRDCPDVTRSVAPGYKRAIPAK